MPRRVVEQNRGPNSRTSTRNIGPRHIVRESGYYSRDHSGVGTSHMDRLQSTIAAQTARREAVEQTRSSATLVAITEAQLPKKSLKKLWGNSFGRAKSSLDAVTGFSRSLKESTKTENASNGLARQRRAAPTNAFMVGFSQKSSFRDFCRDEVMQELNQIDSTASSRIVQTPVRPGSTNMRTNSGPR
jgi:hypothetical protein